MIHIWAVLVALKNSSKTLTFKMPRDCELDKFWAQTFK
jgi:hypothetical protein